MKKKVRLVDNTFFCLAPMLEGCRAPEDHVKSILPLTNVAQDPFLALEVLQA